MNAKFSMVINIKQSFIDRITKEGNIKDPNVLRNLLQTMSGQLVADNDEVIESVKIECVEPGMFVEKINGIKDSVFQNAMYLTLLQHMRQMGGNGDV